MRRRWEEAGQPHERVAELGALLGLSRLAKVGCFLAEDDMKVYRKRGKFLHYCRILGLGAGVFLQ